MHDIMLTALTSAPLAAVCISAIAAFLVIYVIRSVQRRLDTVERRLSRQIEGESRR